MMNGSPATAPGGTDGGGASGTILEAAFVDPAYSWPPAEGQHSGEDGSQLPGDHP